MKIYCFLKPKNYKDISFFKLKNYEEISGFGSTPMIYLLGLPPKWEVKINLDTG